MSQGGHGIKDLELLGLALRVPWEWFKHIEPNKPWQGLNLPCDEKAREGFQSCTEFLVGDGKNVFFWCDRCILGRTAHKIAPEFTTVVTTRRKNCRKVADAVANNAWV
jgi:hypothetical protein